MSKFLEIRPGRLAGNLSTGPRLPVQKLVRPASRKSCGGELKKLRRTCWRIRMKRQPASYAEASDSSFPLFSQKGAGDSTLQVQAGKRVVVVSTDSQNSSQQQGFIYLALDRTSCSRDLWLCKFERSGMDSYRASIRSRPYSYVVDLSCPYAHELRGYGTQTDTEFLAGLLEAR